MDEQPEPGLAPALVKSIWTARRGSGPAVGARAPRATQPVPGDLHAGGARRRRRPTGRRARPRRRTPSRSSTIGRRRGRATRRSRATCQSQTSQRRRRDAAPVARSPPRASRRSGRAVGRVVPTVLGRPADPGLRRSSALAGGEADARPAMVRFRVSRAESRGVRRRRGSRARARLHAVPSAGPLRRDRPTEAFQPTSSPPQNHGRREELTYQSAGGRAITPDGFR